MRSNPVRIDFWGDEIEGITDDRTASPARWSTTSSKRCPSGPRRTTWPRARTHGPRAFRPSSDELRRTPGRSSRRRARCWKRSAWSMRTNIRPGDDGRQMGFCSGIENYSRHIDGRAPGDAAATRCIDYFPRGLPAASSTRRHVTVPQIRGDARRRRVRARSRLPSTVSACPVCAGQPPAALRRSSKSASGSSCTCRPRQATTSRRSARQHGGADHPSDGPGRTRRSIVRRSASGQIDDLHRRGRRTAPPATSARWSPTLTKKMAEDLTDHLLDQRREGAHTCTRTSHTLRARRTAARAARRQVRRAW